MSGSGTNAGIDFQGRLAAWYMIHMFRELNMVRDLDEDYIDLELVPTEIRFEASEEVDDINVLCSNGYVVLIQAKTSLNLSPSSKSEFFKVVSQIVTHFLAQDNDKHFYLIATSSKASSLVIRELRKLLVSIRLNGEGFIRNPLSQSENKAYSIYRQVIEAAFEKHTRRKITEAEFVRLSQQIHISVFDIQQGDPYEKMALLLLAQDATQPANLIWSSLFRQAIDYASKRYSINRDVTKRILRKYYLRNEDQIAEADFLEFFDLADNYPSGKDVVVVEADATFVLRITEVLEIEMDQMPDYLVMEMFRFDENCERKVSFKNGKCILQDGITELKLILRSATWDSLIRLTETDKDIFGDNNVLILPANDIDNVEDSECAKSYSKRIIDFLSSKFSLNCLHCSKAVSESESLLVEIDEEGFPFFVGTLHRECLRPSDRIIGRVQNPFFEHYPSLKNFDVQKWIRLLREGVSSISGFALSMEGKHQPIVVWSPPPVYSKFENYCIKAMLDDGSFRYMNRGKKIGRFTKSEGERMAHELTEMFARAIREKDPFGYTLPNSTERFGKYSFLRDYLAEGESFVKCLRAEAVQYSHFIEEYSNSTQHFYTPICVLRDIMSGKLIALGKYILFISDPLEFENIFHNWQQVGIPAEGYEIEIIENDDSFNEIMLQLVSDGMAAVVDAKFDSDLNMIGGILIERSPV